MKPCLIWPDGLDKEGYAITTHYYKQYRVAKLVLEDKLGRVLNIPKELTRHLCHNKACIEPTHLEVGTSRDNYLDNYKEGKRYSNQKLSDDDVRLIRQLRIEGHTCAAIAIRFGIASSMVSAIEHGQRKAHVRACE